MRSQTFRLAFVLLIAMVVSIVVSWQPTVLSHRSAVNGSMPIQSELTLQEKRGKAFYLRGESASGQEITALVGEVDVPASTLSCAGCHGVRGEGRTEGGVTAGKLTWSFLTRPSGHEDQGGRKHPAYSESSFERLLKSGLDPAGNKLLVAMPTYRMPQEDMANLIAYLKRIETDTDPGVSDKSILLGTVVPEKNALQGIAQSIVDVLQAYFDDVNSHGGIHNRRIELRIRYGDSEATVTNLRHLVDDDRVFAVVSGITAGSDKGVSALTVEKELPFIGPSTLLPQRGRPLNRYLFYLLSGLNEQARALVYFAARKTDATTLKAAIVSPDTELNRNIEATIEAQTNSLRWTPAITSNYSSNGFNATQEVRELNQKGINTVFFLGSGAEAIVFLKEAERVGWEPSFYMLGALLGRAITDAVPAGMKDRVFLAFPTVPADVSQTGAAEFGSLLESHKLERSHPAAQASALAAAKVVVRALELCGKDLSRERFITALEGLYEFDTGLMRKITFGPNRRIGILGAYIVTIDPEKKLFPATVEWIAVD